jgi:hypothetical protein
MRKAAPFENLTENLRARRQPRQTMHTGHERRVAFDVQLQRVSLRLEIRGRVQHNQFAGEIGCNA